ncbi:hypothetical protein PanWU01x14_219180 [Parasponia andersonii]|uniref:Uncharacterized protein n=1 Tax=Parasponia andersonii TaxID=3476 RepID=A0A2P5BQL3_PARAD|nr:hypothetical protein PanWU01x14_219180 [Parasponia andersonii]
MGCSYVVPTLPHGREKLTTSTIPPLSSTRHFLCCYLEAAAAFWVINTKSWSIPLRVALGVSMVVLHLLLQSFCWDYYVGSFGMEHGRVFKYFGESRNHLHKVEYITKPRELTTHCLNVFELEKDYARWVLKFKVDLVEISNVFPEFEDYRFYVLCMVHGELDEDLFLELNIPGKVL